MSFITNAGAKLFFYINKSNSDHGQILYDSVKGKGGL